MARFIHAHSLRASGPFVAVNCAALPESLVEGEFFGHVRGAYTGAHEHARGLFAEAAGGTLFLDEVGELSRAAQAKLLRVLDGGEFRPVGGKSTRRVDVRVLAASNRPLVDDATRGENFRLDLLHRLAAAVLVLPPLRERLGDVRPLAEHFLSQSGSRARLSAEAMHVLESHPWPGNVRQLRNVVLVAGAVCDGATIHPRHLTEQVGWGRAQLAQLISKAERDAVLGALAEAGGRVQEAARLLGVSRATMYRKLKHARGRPLPP
jgi:DNA-binding NtrC family response regulator